MNRSFPPFDTFQALPDEGIHIAVIHGSLEGAMFAELHKRDVPLKLENLEKTGMDYIALGHIHSAKEYSAGSIPVVYPGTLEGKRFIPCEEGTRNLVVVEIEVGRMAKIEFIPWNKRVIEKTRLDLDNEVVETEDELVALIIDRYGDPNKLLRLELSGTAPFIIDIETIDDRLSGEFYWCEILDNTNIFNSALVDEWINEETIRGLYIRKLSSMVEEIDDPAEKDKMTLALKIAIQSFSKNLRRV